MNPFKCRPVRVTRTRCGSSCLLAALLFGATAAHAAPYVVNAAGQRIDGVAVCSQPDGTVQLTLPGGQVLSFRPGMFRQAVADKPVELEQVGALVRQGNYDAAAERLQNVKQTCRFLGWDLQASRMLARVELARNRPAEAAAEYETLFAAEPKLRLVPAERARYTQALLGAGRTGEAAALIDEEIASGSREAAARAQLLRSDLLAAAGRHEEALLDCLRTVLLFKDQPDVQPEALYKTAVALRRMKDPRAADYFQQVIRDYPDSEYAAAAGKEQGR